MLSYCLGGGERDVPLPDDRRSWLDMRFRIPDGPVLGVEYDGAYWHHGEEAADERKSHRVRWAGLADVVMRLRETPLRPLDQWDVSVPKKPTGSQVAQLALTHLTHLGMLDRANTERVSAFLDASLVSIDPRTVQCRDCRHHIRYLTDRPSHAKSAQAQPDRGTGACWAAPPRRAGR